jgi:predicted amino acid dehydrogenase
MGRFWPPLRYIPNTVYDRALRTLPVPTIMWGNVRMADQPGDPAGWLLLVPLGARQMLSLRRNVVLKKIEAALDKAAAMGAEIVGLGALTAPVTKGGQKLLHRTDLGITNGNAFTAAMTFSAIERLLPLCQGHEPEITVVGASGSVGSCVVSLLARHRTAARLTLVARDLPRLRRVADLVGRIAPDIRVRATNDLSTLRDADLVVLLTSSADAVLRSEHLKPGAIVLDDTQPRNTDPALLKERPDVRIVDGGVVEASGVRLMGGDIGLPRGHLYACLTETILLALDGHNGHYSIGAPTLEQADHMLHLAHKYREFGFGLAPFHSFGRPLAEMVSNPQQLAEHRLELELSTTSHPLRD